MRRAVCILFAVVSLVAGSLAGVADEPVVHRGQTTAQWLEQLSHPSPAARAAAAQALVTIGNGRDDAAAPLIGLLSDRDEQVRFYAAYALGKLEVRPQQCLAALIKALPDKDENVRYTIQWSLAEIAKQITVSSDDKLEADESLAELLPKAETQLLVTGALPGHLKQVRAAMSRIGRVAPGSSDEIESCLQALASEDLRTKLTGMEMLKKLGPAGVERLFASPDVVAKLGSVRWHLPAVIAGLGEPVLPVLMSALRNAPSDVGELAADALSDLGPAASAALPDLTAWLVAEDTPEAIRQHAIGIMLHMGPAAADATDALARTLNDADRDDSIQASAAEALGAIGPAARRAVPALIARMAKIDGASYVRSAIASALAKIDPKSDEVTRALVTAFHESENIFDALDIASRLCECGPGASAIVPRLIEAIDETSYDERADVMRLLGELGKSQADEVTPLVFARLMDPAEELMVRAAAARALGKLGPAAVQPIADELRDGDEANQLIAARAIVEIGAAASPALEALHEIFVEPRAESELRALAAVALGQIGSQARDSAPALAELLSDPESDSYLRSMSAVALGQIDPAAVAVLESTLDDRDAEVQIAAAYALCKLDPRHVRGLAVLTHWLESDEHRGSAIAALVDIGETALVPVVAAMNDPAKSHDTRVACLEAVSSFDERAVAPLLDALNDEAIAEEAGWALRDRGNELLPTLVAGMEDESNFTPQARAILGNVIDDMFSGLGSGGGDAVWEGGHALVRRPAAAFMAMEMTQEDLLGDKMEEDSGGGLAAPEKMRSKPAENLSPPRNVQPDKARMQIAEAPPVPAGYKTVDVFYGTNRKPADETSAAAQRPARRGFWWAAIGLSIVVIVLVVMYRRGAKRQATAGLAGTILMLFLGLLLFAPAIMHRPIDKSGPRYGGEYSERVEMGICQVTIPDVHREGELEGPALLKFEVAEDLQKHIVLRSVRRLQPEAFFAGLQQELQSKGNNVLVFIHGYNVSFEDAARRTAQMSADLKFAGAPVFYSWPSQAEVWKYRVDEKNVALSVDQLKSFLVAVAERSGADTINLVAHSMGNRVLTEALKELDAASTARQQLFNQVILAAPDIDADIFKQRIAPAIVTKAKHITLYASSRDLALVASRTFNGGDPRAGDAGENLIVVPGIETIDVSGGDSSLLGHSYYGDNVSVLRDIELVLRDRPAGSRQFLEPVFLPGDRSYWMFRPERIARRIDGNDEPR